MKSPVVPIPLFFVGLTIVGGTIVGCGLPQAPSSPDGSETVLESIATPVTPLPSTPLPSTLENDAPKAALNPILEDLISRQDQLQLCQNIPFDRELSRNNSQVYSLPENQFLVTVVCGIVKGQYIHENYRYEPGTPNPIVTPLMVAFMKANVDGETTTTTVRTVEGAGQYDPIQQTLTITTLFDQLGECGMVGFYQLNQTTFEIQKLFAKPDCTTGYVDPKDYPQVYP